MIDGIPDRQGRMAEVTLGGNPVHTIGELPEIGTKAPDFAVTGKDLGEITRDSLAGKKVVLNIFPSIDTPTCQASVRHSASRRS